VICFFQAPLGVGLMLALIAYQVFTYFSGKAKVLPYLTGLSYLVRLIRSCKEISDLSFTQISPEQEILKNGYETLKSADGAGSFVLKSSEGGQMLGSGSGPVEVLISYLNLLFHLDLIAYRQVMILFSGKKELLLNLLHTVGRLDAGVAVAAFRASLRNGWCKPEFSDSDHPEIRLEGGYHYLLKHPVRGSITTNKGILITGSNASGKSTFLRMVALNAVLAQTIHTALATRYEAPFFRIYSSIALTDDLAGGDSYFMVEIKAIKRILDASESEGRPVLCFVDEVLRGTNTAERIAASTEILREMAQRRILVFAATHDRELTEYLKDSMENYHFEEKLEGKDISFSYELLPGPATTKNAILLLRQCEFPESLVLRAEKLSQSLEET
jgi:DNA mismatch repair ATPase MutS